MPKKKLNPSEKIAKDIPIMQVPWNNTKLASETLHHAFADDSLMSIMLRAARNPHRAIHENFSRIIGRARINGIVMRTSENHEGVAVWYLTGFARSSLLLDAGIALYKLREFRLWEIREMLPFYMQVERAHIRIIKQPHYYLEILGVVPQFQGQGYASKLLKPMLAQADDKRKKCYLETHSDKNVTMYEHFGFQVVDTIPVFFSDIPYRLMLRKPDKSGSYF